MGGGLQKKLYVYIVYIPEILFQPPTTIFKHSNIMILYVKQNESTLHPDMVAYKSPIKEY